MYNSFGFIQDGRRTRYYQFHRPVWDDLGIILAHFNSVYLHIRFTSDIYRAESPKIKFKFSSIYGINILL